MSLAAVYREIVSGRRRDWPAGAARLLLTCLEPLYHLEIARRNRAYDTGRRVAHRVEVPVISVGNVTTGGTGKTPFVAWLVEWLTNRERRVAVVSRGYGARPGELNDEGRELALRLPAVPHFQNADRVAAARQAIETAQCDVIVLDDAFQHRRLHRDLDLVLIDALEPFGCDHLLPRGFLREPLSALARADGIIVSRANLVDESRRVEIVTRLRSHVGAAWIAETAQRPMSLWCETVDDVASNAAARVSQLPVSRLRDARVAAFCGLGNPRAFYESLQQCGAKIVDFREYSDHFSYGPESELAIEKWVAGLAVDYVVCTLKDLVKLSARRFAQTPLTALMIGVEFTGGEEFLTKQLLRVLADPQRVSTRTPRD